MLFMLFVISNTYLNRERKRKNNKKKRKRDGATYVFHACALHFGQHKIRGVALLYHLIKFDPDWLKKQQFYVF